MSPSSPRNGVTVLRPIHSDPYRVWHKFRCLLCPPGLPACLPGVHSVMGRLVIIIVIMLMGLPRLPLAEAFDSDQQQVEG